MLQQSDALDSLGLGCPFVKPPGYILNILHPDSPAAIWNNIQILCANILQIVLEASLLNIKYCFTCPAFIVLKSLLQMLMDLASFRSKWSLLALNSRILLKQQISTFWLWYHIGTPDLGRTNLTKP